MNQTLDSRPVQIVIVLNAHGIDTSQYTFTYVLGWASAAAKAGVPVEELVAQTGQRVVATADAILQHTSPDDPTTHAGVDALATSLDLPPTSTPTPGWEAVGARVSAHPTTAPPLAPALAVAP